MLANGSLYVYKTCPAVLLTPPAELALLGLEAARWLVALSLEDLRRISLDLGAPVLAEKYISLSIQIFDHEGVNLQLR